MKRDTELKGKIFGHLLAVDFVEKKNGQIYWKCECTRCGRKIIVTAHRLHNGQKTCGCAREKGRNNFFYRGGKYISLTRWKALIKSAQVRGIPFLLTLEEAESVLEQQNFTCVFSGLPLYLPQTRQDMQNNRWTASLDRIDSSQPYQLDNIQWIYKPFNRMKRNHSNEEFITLCTAVANYQKNLSNKETPDVAGEDFG